MVGPLLPLLCVSNGWEGVNSVWLIEKFRKHGVALDQTLLDLIYGCLWECASESMKNGPLWFTVVIHKDRAFDHNLEVGPFPSEFVFSYVLGPFMRADEDIGRSREVVYLFESKVVNLTCVIFQVQDAGD